MVLKIIYQDKTIYHLLIYVLDLIILTYIQALSVTLFYKI